MKAGRVTPVPYDKPAELAAAAQFHPNALSSNTSCLTVRFLMVSQLRPDKPTAKARSRLFRPRVRRNRSRTRSSCTTRGCGRSAVIILEAARHRFGASTRKNYAIIRATSAMCAAGMASRHPNETCRDAIWRARRIAANLAEHSARQVSGSRPKHAVTSGNANGDERYSHRHRGQVPCHR